MKQTKLYKLRTLMLSIITLTTAFSSFAQLIEYHDLPESLAEISGLEVLNDSTLVAFNDGGNKTKLYLLDHSGKIRKKVEVLDVKNRDWEDIAIDNNYLYIGDIGNNANKRKSLKIYKIKLEDIQNKKEVKAEKIKFNYGEQTNYPPAADSMFYDAEGMTLYNDSIWVFTKNRSRPSNGLSLVYKIPTTPGEYTVYKSDHVFIGKNGWLTDGITAVDVYEDHFYFLTYDRYIVKKYHHGMFEDVSSFEFKNVSQRESIVVLNKQSIFVADEKNPLVGSMKLYKIRPARD